MADSIHAPIRAHPLAESQLVKPLTNQPRHVAPPSLIDDLDSQIWPEHLRIVHADGEGQRGRIVADDEDRPLRAIPAGRRPEKVDDRELTLHGAPKPHVVVVAWVVPR